MARMPTFRKLWVKQVGSQFWTRAVRAVAQAAGREGWFSSRSLRVGIDGHVEGRVHGRGNAGSRRVEVGRLHDVLERKRSGSVRTVRQTVLGKTSGTK